MRTWYDPYGRVEETLNNHIARLNDLNADRTTYEYDFADNILVANRDHRKPDGANLSITDEMNWDHAGRQVDHYLNIGGQRTHLSQQDYTAKDQLKEKDLGVSTSTSSSLQSLDYAYLANGFLRGINHVQTESDDWFQMGIHYDQPDGTTISGFTPQYNGNIGALSWQAGTGNEQIYRYAYDYLDRITSAQMTGNTYRTAYSYDQRGNLLTLDRYDANGTMIDDLEYFNYSGTNRINTIVDSGTPAGFDKGNAIVFAAYNYDANGNLIGDPYKNLEISYNHLNLPDTVIQPGSNNRIVYLYDAAGNKLRKEVLNDSLILTGPFTENQYRARFITTDGQPTSLDSTLLIAQDSIVFKPGFHAQAGMRLTAKIDSTIAPVDQTDYIGGIEYRNDDIQAIYHPVGRAVPSGSNCVFAGGYDEQCWRHEFVITDHLGNTRLRFSDLDGNTQIDSTEILDEITYYPFGSPWQDAGYRYTYNGKELDRELGLRWHHYGRRMFDPVIARFTGVDPISDQFAWVSTYNYAENEPIANIDLHGLQRTRYDVRLDVEAKQTINGEQSPAEFKAFLRAEGQGALVGISLVSPVDEVSLGLGLLSRTAVGRATSNFLSSAASRLTGLFRNSRKGIEEFADQALTRDEMAKIVGRGPSFPSASAYDFVPGEPVKKSVVEKLADDMKINGFDKTNPIETVELYGKKYILDGHHRVEAAKKAGADVYYKELSPEEAVKTFRFRDVEEIIWRAIEFNNK
jgi:RHS repeat-associated protein